MYQAAQKGTWTGRIDPLDGEDGLRWHQKIQYLDLSSSLEEQKNRKDHIAFLGFCCDEGVKRNQGRAGAFRGPEVIKKAMASMASHLQEQSSIYDAGDVSCLEQNLEECQAELASHVARLLSHNYFPILLGGGHEIAFGHFAGIHKYLKEKSKFPKIGIINIDAHFDLRSYEVMASSGTPFRQIADLMKAEQHKFSYLCLGIQDFSNTKALFKTADDLGVDYLKADKVTIQNQKEVSEILTEYLSDKDYIYLSVDLDSFAAPFAPGVSAPALYGLMPEIVFSIVKQIAGSGRLLSCDIAEMNPEYDLDSRTAKLAAALIYLIVSTLQNKS